MSTNTATKILGLHHVTAMSGDPQTNIDFYAGILGLRMVKVTVNFDDPHTYHLYYGDGLGRPGTLMTFFPWPGARKGNVGIGQVGVTAFSIPKGSMDFWVNRLSEAGVPFFGPEERFGDQVLSFVDPDEMPLELVESSEGDPRDAQPWNGLGADVAIRGFHSVELWLGKMEGMEALLQEIMGLNLVGEDQGRSRLAANGDLPGNRVDLVHRPGTPFGTTGVGTVHHVAWRVESVVEQEALRQTLERAGLRVTEIVERNYFKSIYFRTPGGVLFEVATDGPGFDIDEPLATMGTTLQLPEQYEAMRSELQRTLPELVLPDGTVVAK